MIALAAETIGLIMGLLVLLTILGITAMVVRWFMYREVKQPVREVSKRRLGHMWVVDEDNIGYVKVVPRLPKRTEVQMYDEEQGKGGWLE